MISVFLIGLALLIALALAFVLPALLRRSEAVVPSSTAPDAARQTNLRVLREQLRALETEHASGGIDAAQYQSARTEIEQRALQEDSGAERVQAGGSRAGRTALVLGLFVPFFALVLYGVLGTPQAVLPHAGGMTDAATQQPEFTQAQVEDMVARLAQRMEGKTTAEASDLEGWVMLARSYGVLQRYPEAAKAYARARVLAPNDAQLLADSADVLAMVQGQRVGGEPLQLVEQALRIDPRNLKALALAGSAAFERKDYATTLRYWNEALAVAPAGSEFAQGLQSGIRDAQQAMAGGAASAAAAATPAAAAPSPAVTGAAQGGLTGTVQLAPALAAKVAPTDTVFVFARAEQGSRMPLAILKRSASELPLRFQLDDSNAMAPDVKLSGTPRVIVGARISRSGDAMPRSGDMSGQTGPVAPGANNLVITIDSVQP